MNTDDIPKSAIHSTDKTQYYYIDPQNKRWDINFYYSDPVTPGFFICHIGDGWQKIRIYCMDLKSECKNETLH